MIELELELELELIRILISMEKFSVWYLSPEEIWWIQVFVCM